MTRANLQFLSDFKNTTDELKPREKLEEYGPQALALWELVALVLRTGVRHPGGHLEDIEKLSKRLVAEGGFKGLFTQHKPADTQALYQVYRSHAYMLTAVSEICRRIQGKYDTFDVGTPEKTAKKFQDLRKAKQEQCFVLHVNEHGKAIYQELVAIGTKQEVTVTPTDVLRSALWLGAKRIIVIHNHPNAPAKASKNDISWTLTLAKGIWEMHQIKLVDHVIIGQDGYFSFQEQGLL